MPTGYTADIKDDSTFPEFAMRCARAFDALITMRDEPSGAPIPERFEVSTYHQDEEAKARVRLAEVESWNERRSAFEAGEAYAVKCEQCMASLTAMMNTRHRYEAMLAQVQEWTPPTPEHNRFKEFMVEQLQTSIEGDCNYTPHKPERLSGPDYKARQIADAQRDIDYHTERHEAEVARVKSRNEWISELRRSLVGGQANNRAYDRRKCDE